METFSALLALCVGTSPVTGELSVQRPVTRSFDVFFDLRLNKRLSKQSWGCWFETPSRSSWRHRNVTSASITLSIYNDRLNVTDFRQYFLQVNNNVNLQWNKTVQFIYIYNFISDKNITVKEWWLFPVDNRRRWSFGGGEYIFHRHAWNIDRLNCFLFICKMHLHISVELCCPDPLLSNPAET